MTNQLLLVNNSNDKQLSAASNYQFNEPARDTDRKQVYEVRLYVWVRSAVHSWWDKQGQLPPPLTKFKGQQHKHGWGGGGGGGGAGEGKV